MPCPHLVKIIFENNGCLSYYINERWYHDKQNAAIRKATRPGIKYKRI
jgi:hypothetical protein